MTTENSADYLKERQIVLDRCQQLEKEAKIAQRNGSNIKASRIRNHIIFLRTMVDMFDHIPTKEDGEA